MQQGKWEKPTNNFRIHLLNIINMKNFTFFKTSLLCAFVMIGASLSTFSQNTIAGWCMNGQSSWGTNPLAATTADANITVGALTKHNFASSGTAASNAWGGTGFNNNTPTGGDVYAHFNITPNTGFAITFTSIKLNYRRSAQGPKNALFQYSLDNVSYTTFATITYDDVTTATAGVPIDLSTISALNAVAGTVYFRFIPYGATNANGTWYIPYVAASQYDLDVKGDVNPTGTNNVATPTITPNGGTFFTSQLVTISCATDGATIRYTIDGSEPTETGGTLYTTPITISTTTTLKAKAWKTGMTESAVRTAIFTLPIAVPNIAAFKATTTVTNPTVYKIIGDVTFVYRTGRYIFIKDDTGGLVIYDNATPIITSTYSNGDKISGGIIGSCTVFHGLYQLIPSVNTAAGTPGATVLPKVVTMAQLLANFDSYQSQLLQIESVTFDAGTFGTGAAANIIIHQGSDEMICRNHFGNLNDYVTDPSKPYHVAGFAIPYDTDREICPRNPDDIFLPGSVVEPPQFSPAGGNYSEPVTVTITCATANAKIYYTTNGSEPTETSTLYTTPFTISETTTVKARGFLTDFTPSIIVSATYKFQNPDQVATPTFNPQGGTFTNKVEVSILCATEGASIYYTLNGNTPTEQDMLYVNPIEISEGTAVLKAKAFKTGMEPSDVATATYIIQVGIHEWDTPINIYPNPTTGQLTIDNGQLTINNVEVFDIYGKKVFEQKDNLTVLRSYDLTVFPAGIYFLKISTEKGDVFKRIIKN